MKLKSKYKISVDNYTQMPLEKAGWSKSNILPLFVVLFLIFVILITTLFNMQIVEGSNYLLESNQNYKSQSILRAARGNIYDTKGTKLVFNSQIYSVYIDSSEFSYQKDARNIANLLGINELEIKEKIEKENVFGRVTLKTDMSHNEYLNLSNQINNYNGVYIRAETGRTYIDNEMYTHIVGYLGDASEENLNDRVDPFSRVGKTGLENKFDYELRGIDGIQVSEVDITDGDVSRYIPNSPKSGDNIFLTIDNDWQYLAHNLLRDKVNATNGLGGSMVVMDTESGEIKVLASYPSFDVDQFSKGISNSDFQAILEDPRSPLLDRSIGVAIPTGSIFKVFSAAIGLEEGVIDGETKFASTGCMTLPGELEFCESFFRVLGDIDVYSALSLSSNIYFCHMGMRLEKDREGIETLNKYTDYFGIGKPTGIILPGEAIGSMATRSLKERIYGEPWYVGDMCNTAIGQGLVSATPLQMAVAMAAIENNGKILEPLFVKKIEDMNGVIKTEYQTTIKTEVPISDENFGIVKKGMENAVREYNGTVRRLNFYPGYIIGKTGTATASVTINGVTYDEPHAWVMGVFEFEGRRYSFVINIAHGGWGESAVDIVQRFLQSIPSTK